MRRGPAPGFAVGRHARAATTRRARVLVAPRVVVAREMQDRMWLLGRISRRAPRPPQGLLHFAKKRRRGSEDEGSGASGRLRGGRSGAQGARGWMSPAADSVAA